MALVQRLDLRQGQALVMTPQLQQAIKLLQLSNIELSAYVEGEVEQNPLLERDDSAPDGAEAPPAEAPAPEASAPGEATHEEAVEAWHEVAGNDGEGNLDYAGDPDAWRLRGVRSDGDDLPGIDQTLARPVTLREHLLAQLAEEIKDPIDRVIGAYMVDQIDEAGYLTVTLDSVAATMGCELAHVEGVLKQLQRFEPTGVFARDLAECLAIQLRERDRYDPAMQALVENLSLLACRDIPQLLRVCRVDAADLAEMASEIRALDPKPGLQFDGAIAQPVVPDVFVRAQGDGWTVELNSDSLPRVLINTRYYAEVNASTRNKAAKEYLAEKYQSANWLVKALHQRATTILKVSREIIRQQDAFLRHGVQHLKPLVLRDIAQAIGMHESTVSRATTNKYMLTPRGIFELKYFFTSAIAAASGGDALSAEAVRFRIKSLIDAEANDVLSDDRIVDILMKEGVDIARRTVAKYREAMNIPSSVQRRRERALQL
ncbi:MAG TPA: RNA polymerase factor sigma-54 [Stellaceae bacterium]|nr:RNA polymerase factor sigma-54 [Stellaceae bacterium]